MQTNSKARDASPRTRSGVGLGRLARAASRGWRILGTIIGFAQAGVSCLLMAFVIFPIIWRLPGSRAEKELRSQRWLRRSIRLLIGTVELLGVMRLRCSDVERLSQPGVLVVANHPTLIDAICLMALMPQADCVVKASHYDSLFLGGVSKGAGFIPNVDGPQLVADCVDRLARGRSVIVFPEGTRSPVDGLGHFARGAAYVALKSGCDPIPVTIKCEPATLHHGIPWWDVPQKRFTMTLTVDEPLIVKDVLEQPTAVPVAARKLNSALRNRIEGHLIVA